MDQEDFLFEQQSYQDAYRYHDDDEPKRAWWDIRGRWASLSGGHRTNVVLYGLSAVSLALLIFEVTAGENNPDLETASRVATATASSTTSTSRPAATTTSRPRTTTSSTIASTSNTTRASTAATTRQPVVAGRQQAAPVETGDPDPDPDPPAADPDPPANNPPQQTTVAPNPTTQPTTAPTTSPPATDPPTTDPPDTTVTLSERACELLAQVGRTHPSCP